MFEDIANNDFKPSRPQFIRESSFQKRDIDGAQPKTLIPEVRRS